MTAQGVKPWFEHSIRPGPWYCRPVDYVVLEREYPDGLTPERLHQMAASLQCLDLYRVKPICSYLAPDGKRVVCVFQAPDAEALRALGRANDFPANSIVWSSTLHTP